MKIIRTRLHSSRMRTARALTIWGVPGPGGGGAWSRERGCLVWGEGVPGPGEGVPGPGEGVPGLGVPGLGGALSGCVPGPGVCAWSGGCTWSDGVPGLGCVCLVWGGAWSRGVCLVWGAGLGGVVVSQHALRQTIPREQNDKQVSKY